MFAHVYVSLQMLTTFFLLRLPYLADGGIPTELGRMVNMHVDFNLFSNRIRSSIPSELGMLVQMYVHAILQCAF